MIMFRRNQENMPKVLRAIAFAQNGNANYGTKGLEHGARESFALGIDQNDICFNII